MTQRKRQMGVAGEQRIANLGRKPLVSICIPAYNSGKFIGRSIESLLAQDYEYFELIISDNASGDETQEICLHYQSLDPRIHYHRNERNIGISKNLNQLIKWASGEYFMYAESHNLLHPTYISRCVELLENYPEAILSHTRTILIDPDDNPLEITSERVDTRNLSSSQRYLHVLWNIHWCDMQNGVIRTNVMKNIRGFKQILGCDNAVLAELALRGEAMQIDEPLYYRRRMRGEVEDKDREARYRRITDPTNVSKSKIISSKLYRQLVWEHMIIVLRSSITYREKLALLLETIYRFASRMGICGSLIAPPVRFFRPQLRRLLQKSQTDLKLGVLR